LRLGLSRGNFGNFRSNTGQLISENCGSREGSFGGGSYVRFRRYFTAGVLAWPGGSRCGRRCRRSPRVRPNAGCRRVAFAYPEDDTRKWQQQLAEQQALAKQEKHAADVPPTMITVEKVNFDYTIRGGDESLRPVRVFEDGAKTYIHAAGASAPGSSRTACPRQGRQRRDDELPGEGSDLHRGSNV
jgi:Conjugal transfer protein